MAKNASAKAGSWRGDDLGGTPQGAAQRAVPAKPKKPSLIASFRLMFTFIAGFGLAMLLNGCAGVAASSVLSVLPGVSSQDLRNQTDVNLSEGNFVLVKTNVFGQSRGFALLGFITIVPAEFNTAYGRLYSQAGMESGKAQTLADIAIERTGSYWILFSLPRCTVRADVVQFVPKTGAKPATNPPR